MMNNLLVKQETTKLNSTIFDDLRADSNNSDSSGSLKSGFSVKSVLRDANRGGEEESVSKRPKIENVVYSDAVPIGFLDPLPLQVRMALSVPAPVLETVAENSNTRSCKQFWKAGDYQGRGGNGGVSASYSVGMDHVRVHPRFLHSNATSHKWALGAFAELLDNSLDETCNGATYAKVDMLTNTKDGSKMLLVKDNGGGMSPDKMRQCMSLGYSEKSKSANTIGQYGNGFKTSTMRLGADVIVFSRCRGKEGMSPTQSIGMLSYTFLMDTGKEDIVVPIVDYEKSGRQWNKIIRTSLEDWDKNLETLVQWSPYESEEDLIKQFDVLRDQGTRMVIYNLWEDDQGQLELDFDTDTSDIQIRGVNRDEKKIEMAKKYPNSRHFLTYQHSLRSYASILYLRLPPGFRIILRGTDVDHHNLVNDMMMSQKIVYKPMAVADRVPNCSNMLAVVTVGFVKDARDHIDIQGFNVYHKNRLIKPFWRVWNAAGSDGRGVIGVLEANFIEPAHDKQGFERTTVLSRLEARLVVMQKQYWSSKCQEIGYAPRRHKKPNSDKEYSPPSGNKPTLLSNQNGGSHSSVWSWNKPIKKSVNGSPPSKGQNKVERTAFPIAGCSYSKGVDSGEDSPKEKSEPVVAKLVKELQFERDRCKSLETQLQEAQQKIETMDKEQVTLIDIFQEEMSRRDEGEENMRKRMEDASTTIEELLGKLKRLENTSMISCKFER